MENTEKILCLEGTIFNFIELSPFPEEIENANEILCEQNSRAIEIQSNVENYFETSSKYSKVCSSKVSKSKKCTCQRSSKNSSSSSHLNQTDQKPESFGQFWRGYFLSGF